MGWGSQGWGSEISPSAAPAGTPSSATSTNSMSSICRRRSSSPANVTSPTPGCTAACTSCRPRGTGEVVGPAGGGPLPRTERRRRRRRWKKESPQCGLGAATPTHTHCCHHPHRSSLRPLDIEFLQRLSQTVNVVPVIARADSLTIEERESFRRRVIWASRVMGSVGARRRQSTQDEMRSPASLDPAQPEDPLHRGVPTEMLR